MADQELIPVTAANHPLRVEHKRLTVTVGTTVAEIIAEAQPDPELRRNCVVEVDGTPIPQAWWPYLRPKQPVVIRIVPTGGGDDKNPLRTVLLLGVTLAGAGIASGTLLSGLTGGAGFAAQALGATVTLVGRALVNQIAPPPQPDSLGDGSSSTSPSQSISGARNRINRFGVVPRVYGRHRTVPNYAAEPFTEIKDDKQFLRAAFIWGYAPIDVTDIRIGNTPIDEFQEVEHETVSDVSAEGFPSLFPKNVSEQSFNLTLKESDGFNVRTTNEVADRISVDVTFPRGLFEFKDNGDKKERTVDIQVEYAEQGTGNWQSGDKSVAAQSVVRQGPPLREAPQGKAAAFTNTTKKFGVMIDIATGQVRFTQSALQNRSHREPDDPPNPEWGHQVAIIHLDVATGVVDVQQLSGIEFSGFNVTVTSLANNEYQIDVDSGTIDPTVISVTEARSGTFRQSIEFVTPDNTKKYDVRLKRLTPDHGNNDDIIDEVQWTKLRAIQNENPVSMQNIAVTAIRIKATEQLNGVIDQLNGICQAIMPDVDPSTGQIVNNAIAVSPAAAFYDILSGPANDRALANSRIDVDSLVEWGIFTDDIGLDFNYIFDHESSVTEALDLAASAGRASKGLADGKWTVIVDREKTEIAQHFTPRNSINFSSERTFAEKTHAIRARFANRDQNWQQDEITVFNDGFNADGSNGKTKATKFEGVHFRGATSEEQVYRAARYHLAVDELRPETYSFDVDIEHLVATRGDLIRATHDVPQWGSGYGRVVAVNGSEITLDSRVELKGGQDNVVRFRLSDGTSELVDLVDPGSDSFTDVLELNGSSNVAKDDLAMVGVQGKESVELIIKSIEPKEDFTATIRAMDYSPAIFDAHTESIPAFDPRITRRDQFVGSRPILPQLDFIESGMEALTIGRQGTLIPHILVGFSFPSSVEDPPEKVQLRYRKTNSGGPYTTVTALSSEGRIRTEAVDQGADYRLEGRSLNREGEVSRWVVIATSHTVVGAANAPASFGLDIAPDPQSVQVTERVNDPATGTGRISTLTATVTPPDPVENYSHALIFARVQGSKGWSERGPTDANNQYSEQVEAKGQTLEIQARSVSNRGVVDIDGPTTTIDVFDPEEDSANPPGNQDRFTVPKPIRLELVDDKGGGTFVGRNPVFTWDPPAAINFHDIGQEPEAQGAGAGDVDPMFSHYEVDIVVNGNVVNTYRTRQERFEYTFERNVEDNGDPQRGFTVRVFVVTQQNVRSDKPAFLSVFNPPPAVNNLSVNAVGFGTISLSYEQPTDLDWSGTDIHVSDTSGFTVSQSNLVHSGPDTTVILEGIEPGATRYIKFLPRDAFGPGPVSDEISATTARPKAAQVDDLSDWATQISPADQQFIENHIEGDAIPSTRIGSLVAGKIASGVMQATLLMESQGIIRADNAGNWEVTMGAHTLNSNVYLHSAYDGNTVRWGVRESGVMEATGAEIEGTITVSGGTVGGTAVADVSSGAERANAGLNSSGNVRRALRGVDLPSGGQDVGLNMTSDFLGFYDGSSWRSWIDTNGNFRFQGENAGENRITWNSTSGTLEIIGDVKTSSSGERIEIDEANNEFKFVNSVGTPRIRIGTNIGFGDEPGIIGDKDEDNPIIQLVNNEGEVGKTRAPANFTNGDSAIPLPVLELGTGSGTVTLYQADGDGSINIGPQLQIKDENSANDTGFITHAGIAIDQPGQLVFSKNTDGQTYNPGDTISGADLSPSDANGNLAGSNGSGTWKCLGYSNSGTPTLWVKTSN